MIEVVGNPSAGGIIKMLNYNIGQNADIAVFDFLSFSDIRDIKSIRYKARWEIDYKPSKEIAKFKKLLCAETSVRVWTSKTSVDDLCALHYVASLLQDSDVKLSAVFVDDAVFIAKDGKKYSPTCVAECSPLQIEEYALCLERNLSTLEQEEYSAIWRRLTLENAPQRIVQQAKVISINADYCDERIYKIIRQNAGLVKATHLYGKYGFYKYDRKIGCLGYDFLMGRIQALIEEGKLIEVEKGNHPDFGYWIDFSLIKIAPTN